MRKKQKNLLVSRLTHVMDVMLSFGHSKLKRNKLREKVTTKLMFEVPLGLIKTSMAVLIVEQRISISVATAEKLSVIMVRKLSHVPTAAIPAACKLRIALICPEVVSNDI